jgi:crossover junction endodeoxyribonuclease RuvC
MIMLGIDCGLSGALVALHKQEPIEWLVMPTYTVGSHKRVNCAAVSAWICNLQHIEPDNIHAYVELVGAMPKQGVTSMFSFGHASGSIMGILAALEISHTLVTPQSWKRKAGLLGQDKDAARSKAIQIWPYWRELDKKGKGQALADAALIARHHE